jgi:hypothetical protein
LRLEAFQLFDDAPTPPASLPEGWTYAPKRVRRIRSSADLVVALNALFRDMRTGCLPTQDGSRMANTLDVLRRTIESSDHEKRIRELEGTLLARQEGRL